MNGTRRRVIDIVRILRMVWGASAVTVFLHGGNEMEEDLIIHKFHRSHGRDYTPNMRYLHAFIALPHAAPQKPLDYPFRFGIIPVFKRSKTDCSTDNLMQTRSDSVLSWIGLSRVPGVGRVTFRKLVDLFGSPEQVLSATKEELASVEGLSEKMISAITTFPWRGPAEEEVRRAGQAGVDIITAGEASFPENLKITPDPPLYLYVKGALLPEDGNAVAIVGTRKPTHYGLTVTHRTAYELAAAGFTIVSGLARGIDTQAHKGAPRAKGRTIAVLGCGIDRAYPPENKGLMEEIGRRGAVLTENPFGTQPEAGYFPARNRIISGLSRGTVIIEAAEDSGSLITAQYAGAEARALCRARQHRVSEQQGAQQPDQAGRYARGKQR